MYDFLYIYIVVFIVVYTMDELKLTGNCLLGSRPLLSFDSVRSIAVYRLHFGSNNMLGVYGHFRMSCAVVLDIIFRLHTILT